MGILGDIIQGTNRSIYFEDTGMFLETKCEIIATSQEESRIFSVPTSVPGFVIIFLSLLFLAD